MFPPELTHENHDGGARTCTEGHDLWDCCGSTGTAAGRDRRGTMNLLLDNGTNPGHRQHLLHAVYRANFLSPSCGAILL